MARMSDYTVWSVLINTSLLQLLLHVRINWVLCCILSIPLQWKEDLRVIRSLWLLRYLTLVPEILVKIEFNCGLLESQSFQMFAPKSNQSIVRLCVLEVPLLRVAYDVQICARLAREHPIEFWETSPLLGMYCPPCSLAILSYLAYEVFILCGLIGWSFVQCILLEGYGRGYLEESFIVIP